MAFCLLYNSQNVNAVVNNGQNTSSEKTSTDAEGATTLTEIQDSAAAASDQEINRRETPTSGLSDSYGAPIPNNAYGLSQDTYTPTGPSNPTLPVPVYGVPDAPSNNIVYPAPPPDVPPPISDGNLANAQNDILQNTDIFNQPLQTYGPPKEVYLPPKDTYGPPNLDNTLGNVGSLTLSSFGHNGNIGIGLNANTGHNIGLNTIDLSPPTNGIPFDTYGPPKENYFPPPAPNYSPPKYTKPIFKPKPIYGPPEGKFPLLKPPLESNLPPLKLDIGSKFPKPIYGPPKATYGPPKPIYGPPKPVYGPPKPIYGPPKPIYGPPKPIYGPPKSNYGPPKPIYGPPKPIFSPFSRLPHNSFKPGGVYGPPKDIYSYGPPHIKSIPPNQISFHIPKVNYGPPRPHVGNFGASGLGVSTNFGSVSFGGSSNLGSSSHFGSSNLGSSGGPIKFSTSANFGTPSIKYGPPAPVYGPPQGAHFGPPDPVPSGPPHPGAPAPPTPPDIKYDGWQPIPGLVSRPPGTHHEGGDFLPPPIGNQGIAFTSQSDKYQGVSDSYGAPLNSVTGSGGIVSSTAEQISTGDNTLSLDLHSGGGGTDVIKSISYELVPNNNGGYGIATDSYNAPLTNSLSSGGSFGLGLPQSDVGLVPPSGLYGAPSGGYGTPLLTSPTKGNAIKPPTQPVVFREPVPSGLIQSIGDGSNKNNVGSTYISPPVPDLTKQNSGGIPPPPSNLYSLPEIDIPISFQNIAHGSSNVGLENSFGLGISNFGGGLSHDFSSGGYNLNEAPAITLTSYNAPLGGALTVGLQQGPPVTLDLTGNYAGQFSSGFAGHDCTRNKQIVPHQTYGVPNNEPLNTYGSPDLQAAHSENTVTSTRANSISDQDSEKVAHAKYLGDSYPTDSEIVKSQSIDLNNIPIQGALGSYTLQIQPADGLGSVNGSSYVPHDQVLNDGLLQSILAAIEQPQKQGQSNFGQGSNNIIVDQNVLVQGQSKFGAQIFDETQGQLYNVGSLMSEVQKTDENSFDKVGEENSNKDDGRTINGSENSEIALYFNNGETNGEQKEIPEQASKASESNDVRNGQQYGSFVSIETPNGKVAYNDYKLAEDRSSVLQKKCKQCSN